VVRKRKSVEKTKPENRKKSEDDELTLGIWKLYQNWEVTVWIWNLEI